MVKIWGKTTNTGMKIMNGGNSEFEEEKNKQMAKIWKIKKQENGEKFKKKQTRKLRKICGKRRIRARKLRIMTKTGKERCKSTKKLVKWQKIKSKLKNGLEESKNKNGQ